MLQTSRSHFSLCALLFFQLYALKYDNIHFNQTFMDQKRKAILERDKKREKNHIRALAEIRTACEDFRHLTESFAGIDVS